MLASVLSRRSFLISAGAAAALAACSSSSGGSAASGSASSSSSLVTTTTRPMVAGDRPDPTRPEGTDMLPQIEHIVVLMMENHSYDSYFGMLPRGDGFTLDANGKPTNSNPQANGTPLTAFHMSNTCQLDHFPWQTWTATHQQFNNGAMDGFVTSPSGPVAMGYWDRGDIPFYYGLAETFPLCDRWFSSCMAQTFPNRRFLLAATSQGFITNALSGNDPKPAGGTIMEALNRNNVSWRNYYTTLPTTGLFLPVFTANADKIKKIDEFFTDAAAGNLPSFSIVDTNFDDESEENGQDLSRGEAFSSNVINAVMQSPNWGTTALIWCYDEHGGYYDHVPPPKAVAPDTIPPMVGAQDAPGGFDQYGIRVPAAIVSPWAKRDYVSSVVHDHTSILKFVETKWNLPAMTNRDAAADNLLDSFDFSGTPPFATPPTLPAPKNPNHLVNICTPGDPGPVPNPNG
jgi:phospholipase C